MVQECVVLGHIVSNKGIEVDKVKVEVIVKQPLPTSIKGVRSFLGHVGFYQRFILFKNCKTSYQTVSYLSR